MRQQRQLRLEGLVQRCFGREFPSQRNEPYAGFSRNNPEVPALSLTASKRTRFNKGVPMTSQNQNPGQQNQKPGQKPGQQQGGGNKPGQQQQDPNRQGQNPGQQGTGGR